MKSNYIISVKSSGLCFNIMRLIILTKLANDFNRKLIFLTKPEHIPILKKFNSKCTLIPYVEGHTDQFNNFTRNKNIHIVYDLKYIRFLKSNYLNKIFGDLKISEFAYVNGCMYDIVDTLNKHIIVDYNDGQFDSKIINSIDIPGIKINKNLIKYPSDMLTINVKINDPDNNRIYDLWDEIIPKLQKDYGKDILLISGNNDIKQYLGKKYNCIFENLDTETNFSNVRGNDIVRGKANTIYHDLITCAHTHFISFIELREKYKDILSRYEDLNFVLQKEEKFDILVEYMRNRFLIQEP